jgi:hypothetical protein
MRKVSLPQLNVELEVSASSHHYRLLTLSDGDG